MIELQNKRLYDYIVEKDRLVDIGRGFSRDIETIDVKIKKLENKEKAITGKVVPPQDLVDKGEALAKQITDLHVELTKIAEAINKTKMDAIPTEMIGEHRGLLKEKEQKERDRNKIALKVQKIKDKLIPIVQKEVKPLLGEYDDIETARAKNGKVVIETFNHMTEFKKRFRR